MRRNDKLEREVAALGDLPYEQLTARWVKTYGCSPPKGVKRGLLERSAAWQLQAKVLGGLAPGTRKAINAATRRLNKIRSRQCKPDAVSLGAITGETSKSSNADDQTAAAIASSAGIEAEVATVKGSQRGEVLPPPVRIPLSPGTRLLREWNGRPHFVDVVPDGFSFDGKTYRSLSAIARRITGAHWSGPRFFGL